MHQMHISLIAGGSTQIAMCISQAKQVNYFPSLFSFIFTLPLQSWALWDGCDEMEHTDSNLSSVCTITFI